MKYYIAVNNERQGPFTTEELAQKGITADTLVWTENMVDWQPAGSLDELRPFIRQVQAVPPQVSAPKKKKKSGCMITLLIALIVLALAVGAAALTNPSKETHQKELSGILSEAIKETLKTKNTSGFELDAVYDKVVPRIIENVSNELLDYNNYFVWISPVTKKIGCSLFDHWELTSFESLYAVYGQIRKAVGIKQMLRLGILIRN